MNDSNNTLLKMQYEVYIKLMREVIDSQGRLISVMEAHIDYLKKVIYEHKIDLMNAHDKIKSDNVRKD